jgi:WD40 repeat protein
VAISPSALVDRLRGPGDSVYSVAFTSDGKCVLDFTGHKDYVLSVAISHDGQWVVSGSKDRSVQFSDKHGRAQLMLQGHKNSDNVSTPYVYQCHLILS